MGVVCDKVIAVLVLNPFQTSLIPKQNQKNYQIIAGILLRVSKRTIIILMEAIEGSYAYIYINHQIRHYLGFLNSNPTLVPVGSRTAHRSLGLPRPPLAERHGAWTGMETAPTSWWVPIKFKTYGRPVWNSIEIMWSGEVDAMSWSPWGTEVVIGWMETIVSIKTEHLDFWVGSAMV